MRTEQAAEFLEMLNRVLVYVDGSIDYRIRDEFGSKRESPLEGQDIVFLKPVDLVIIGHCSRYPEFPFSESIHAKLTAKDGAPKMVLIFPECCWQYGPEYQEQVRATYPGVEWLFPDTKDFFDDLYSDRSLGSLVYELSGILGAAER